MNLSQIIQDDNLHAKWLNTLSYLENCGARKIAACEHPTLVKEEMLKHAAEEFRHALHLKRQIRKITDQSFDTYHPSTLLGGAATLHYLDKLDLQICRYLKSQRMTHSSLRETAYLLVTYAIEMRASALYPLYHTFLKQHRSPVTVKSILLEEEEHLHEMKMALERCPKGMEHAAVACDFEQHYFNKWQESLIPVN